MSSAFSSSSSSSFRLNVSVVGDQRDFWDGGVLTIRFLQRYRKLYHSFEDQTAMILQDQVVGSHMISLFAIPVGALASPRLVKQYLLHSPGGNHFRILVEDALDFLARLVASTASTSLMSGPGRRPNSVGLHLFADVELITHEIIDHLEVEAEEEETVLSRGASKNALMKLKSEESFESDGTCVVCLDELSSEITRMPCNHVFHHSCLLQWLKNTDNCPICRRQLADD